MNAQGVDVEGQAIEPMLEQLIKDHGIEKVTAALSTLFGKAKWADYQRVSSLARNIANRLRRQERKESAAK